jgi:hypothetical protein
VYTAVSRTAAGGGAHGNGVEAPYGAATHGAHGGGGGGGGGESGAVRFRDRAWSQHSVHGDTVVLELTGEVTPSKRRDSDRTMFNTDNPRDVNSQQTTIDLTAIAPKGPLSARGMCLGLEQNLHFRMLLDPTPGSLKRSFV